MCLALSMLKFQLLERWEQDLAQAASLFFPRLMKFLNSGF